MTSNRLSVLDALRGLAALGVCWDHFTGNGLFFDSAMVRTSGLYGWLGVEVFFVISGFVIPYTMQRSGYGIADFGRFIFKRLVRLEPPYLVALFVTIVLEYISLATPGFLGPPCSYSWTGLGIHLVYLNGILGYPWYNPVFWTLAIEVQYYLLIGLLFFAIANKSHVIRIGGLVIMALLALATPGEQFVFHWLFIFMLGMVAFQYHVHFMETGEFLLCLLFLGLGACYVNGFPIAAVSIASALIIGFIRTSRSHFLLFFGDISYSLYLVHVPVGTRVLNLCSRLDLNLPSKLFALFVAMGISILAAWLLYKYVELPAQKWSSAIRFQKRPKT